MNNHVHVALRSLIRRPVVHWRTYATNQVQLPKAVGKTEQTEHTERADGISTEKSSSDDKNATTSPVDPSATDERVRTRKQLRVDAYLASLREAGIAPSIADIEKFKPKRRPSFDSPNYATAYIGLLERLCKSFTKEQLRGLGKLYGLENKWTRYGRRQAEYAESIMEKQWGWENLKEIERRRRDASEVLTKAFPLSASELFVLIGKDGSELLNISNQYKVHVSVTPNPMALQVRGSRGALKKLEPIIATKRKEIIEEIVELPTKTVLPLNMIPQLSRLANAYIENVGYRGKVRICAKDRQSLDAAKRVIFCVATYENHTSRIPVLSYSIPAEHGKTSSYALYPFNPHAQIPWWMKEEHSYRLRRIESWVDPEFSNYTGRSGGFREGLVDVHGQRWPLESIFQTNASMRRRIIATTGHAVIRDATSRDSMLTPPLDGNWGIARFHEWLQEFKPKYSFLPAIPSRTPNSALAHQQMVHRLSYRCLSPQPDEAKTSISTESQVLQFEVQMNRVSVYPPEGAPADESERETAPSQLVLEGQPVSYHLRTSEFLLCLPDERMDLKMEVVDSSEVAIDSFNSVKDYFQSLSSFFAGSEEKQPNPPLLIYNGEQLYSLESNTTIRRRNGTRTLIPNMTEEGIEIARDTRTVDVILEDTLDLETNESTSSCEVQLDNPTNQEDVEAFLSDCHALIGNSHEQERSDPDIDESEDEDVDNGPIYQTIML